MNYPAKFNPQESPYNWFAVFQDAKLKKLENVIRMNLTSQILIFVQYRDTLDKVIKYLEVVFSNKKIDRFIGQSNKLNGRGMTQKHQAEILHKFTCGEIDILVATSIGEQGLNFPAVDVVFFYEPITDPRRIIQRIGRTGRYRDGDVFILAYCREKEQEELILNIAFAKLHKANMLMKYYDEHRDCF
jgi:ERCC4-related helicase